MNKGSDLDDHEEGVGDNHHKYGNHPLEETIATLQFPIINPIGQAPMKNISPLLLQHFHEKAIEDPDEFIFEFNILCCTYDYTSIEKKLNLFPATLKDNALQLFMHLGGETVTTWEQMK